MFFKKYCEYEYLQKEIHAALSEEFVIKYKFLMVNSFDVQNYFLENFMQWLVLQLIILLFKSGIRKHIAVSVNTESVNKSISKIAFHRF